MISGLQKMTLLDYPGKVACTVFLQGCNFRCPFCHNSDLLPRQGEDFLSNEEFFAFLKKRKGLLDAVCVSGGEPTLYPQLPEFLAQIKALGYLVKLDTNGSNPKLLQTLLEEKLVDHVAMDIKNAPQSYAQTVGLGKMDLSTLEESIRLLMNSGISYEFRTTVVAQLHDEGAMEAMGQWLGGLIPGKKPEILYLQKFVDRESVLFSGLSAPGQAQLENFKTILEPFVKKIAIRGE